MGVPGHDRRHSHHLGDELARRARSDGGVEIFPGQLNALGGPAAPGGY